MKNIRLKALLHGVLLWLLIAFVCFLLGAFDDLILYPRVFLVK